MHFAFPARLGIVYLGLGRKFSMQKPNSHIDQLDAIGLDFYGRTAYFSLPKEQVGGWILQVKMALELHRRIFSNPRFHSTNKVQVSRKLHSKSPLGSTLRPQLAPLSCKGHLFFLRHLLRSQVHQHHQRTTPQALSPYVFLFSICPEDH